MRIDLHDGFYLSPIVEGDQAAYVEHFNDKETSDSLLLLPYPYTRDDADRWVQARIEATRDSRPTQFALRRADGYLVGGAGLVLGTGVAAHRAELGYWVARDYRRHGLAGAAIKAMIDLAFRDLGLKRIQAWVFPNNLASQRLLERAGFQREGLLARYHLKDGIAHDVYIYGLVSE